MKRFTFLAVFSLISMLPLYAHGDKGEQGHLHKGHCHQNAGINSIKMSILKIEDKEGKKLVKIKLSHIKNKRPVRSNDLKVVHTEKVHLLIVDDGLEDYSHIHPQVDSKPGHYIFEWEPKKKGNYRMWADLHPLSTDAQEYAIADLISGQEPLSIDRKVSSEATIDQYKFNLSFDGKEIKAGKATMGRISITDDKGQPVKELEPIMGAFAHLVGFGDDFKGIIHIHPMGEEPSKSTDRGGPDLQFHLQPENPGFIKLFLQIKIKGKEIFVPFGINVVK